MRSLHAFGIIRYLLQRFVNSCILLIIFKGYPSFFGEILRKDFTLLHRVMKEVSNVCDKFFYTNMNMVMDRHSKSSKNLPSMI